mgnify:FL=1
MVEYGQRQREYRRKSRALRERPTRPKASPIVIIKHRWGGMAMTIDEVVERAKELYPDLTLKATSARMWTARGLMPGAHIESLGAHGTRAHYPIDAAAQVAAAGYLQDQGFRQKQIAQARQIVLEGVPVEGDLMRDVVALLESGRLQEADSNIFRLPSAEVAAIAGAVQAYAIALATARAGRKMTRTMPPCFHTRQWSQDGKQMFSYFASVLGYYIDPRGAEDITDIAADLDQQIRQQREEIRRKRNTDF